MTHAQIERIREIYEHTKPDPALNSAWASAMHDLGLVLDAYFEQCSRLNDSELSRKAAESLRHATDERMNAANLRIHDLSSRLGSVTNLLDAARGCTDLDAHLTLRAIREVVVETRCEHEWIDIRNKVIESGEMCSKCHALRAGNSAAIVGSRPDMSASGQAPNADSSTGEDRPAAPMFDMNTPLDAPVRIREREERERSQRATARFVAWMDSDEGRRLVQEAYARAKASACREARV